MKKITLDEIEEVLGEATEFENVNIFKTKKRIKPAEEFIMLFFKSFNDIVSEKNLTLADLKVLFKILEYVSYGNLLILSQKDLAEELNITQQAVSKSWQKLIKAEIVFQGEGKKSMFLNPIFMIKGELFKAKNGEVYKEIKGKLTKDLAPFFNSDNALEDAVKSKLSF